MKRLILIIVLFVFAFNSKGQNYDWIQQYGRGGIYVSIEEISSGINDQVIVGGLFEEIVFNDSTYSSPTKSNGNLYGNLFVASYDTDGSENWIKTFASSADMILLSMDVDASGNIYLLFESSEPVTFGSDTFLQDADPSYEGGYQLLKLDPTGNLLWREDQFARSEDLENRGDNIELSDIAVSPTGELYLAMSFGFDYTLANGQSFSASNRNDDPLLIKYNTNGLFAWVIQGDSRWDEQIFEDDKTLDIEVDAEGNVLMGGTFIADDEAFGLSFGSLPSLPVTQSDDGVFLAKFSSDGVPLWLKSFTDDALPGRDFSENEQVRDMVVDGTDILLSIHFNDNLIIGNDTLINSKDPGGFPFNGNAIVKLNKDGDLIWVQQLTGGELYAQIGVDPVNNQYAVLGNYSEVSFNDAGISLKDDRNDYFLALYGNDGNLISVDTTEYISNGGNTIGDKFPMQYLSDGSLLTTMQFGGPGSFTTNPNPPPYGQVVFGNITLDTVFTVMAKIDFNNVPDILSVDLGADIGQCAGDVTLDAGAAAAFLWSTGATSQSITVDTSGIFAVRITDDLGQTATDTIEVTIDQPIAFSFPDSIQGIRTVHLVVPETVAPQMVDSYLWSTSETTDQITVNTSGYYSLKLMTANGCETIDSLYVKINELAVYGGGIGSGASQSELINNISFYGGGNGAGSFESGIVNSDGFYRGGAGAGSDALSLIDDNNFYNGGTGSGDVLVSMVDQSSFYGGGEASGYAQKSLFNGMGFYEGGVGSGYATAEFINQIITKIDDGDILQDIKVFPNPAIDIVTIESSYKLAYAEIFSLSGTSVMRTEFKRSTDQLEVEVTSLPQGTYLVIFHTTKGAILYSKLIKE